MTGDYSDSFAARLLSSGLIRVPDPDQLHARVSVITEHCGISLEWLQAFAQTATQASLNDPSESTERLVSSLVTPLTCLSGVMSGFICNSYSSSSPAHRLPKVIRLWDLIPPQWTDQPSLFVSHAWSAPWRQTIEQLAENVEARKKQQPLTSPPPPPPKTVVTDNTDDEACTLRVSNNHRSAVTVAPAAGSDQSGTRTCADVTISVTKPSVESNLMKPVLGSEKLMAAQQGCPAHEDTAAGIKETFVWLDWVALPQQRTGGNGPRPPDLDRVKAAILSCQQGETRSSTADLPCCNVELKRQRDDASCHTGSQ